MSVFFVLQLALANAARVAVHEVEGKVESAEPLYKKLDALVVHANAMSSILVDRHSSTSVFEQTRYHFEDRGYVSMFKSEYYNSDGFHANWTKTPFGMTVTFKGEEGVDTGGLRKEWVQMVLESIVMPKEAKESAKGMDCLLQKPKACVEGPQYFLEKLPSGEVIPIMDDRLIGRVPEQEKASWLSWVMEQFTGPPVGALSETGKRFKFLGKWIARAYLTSGLGFSPFSFHPWIYESLLAGEVKRSTPSSGYSEEDTIQACEDLVKIYKRRSPAEMKAYGWQSCDEVVDPEGKKYTQQSCYQPIYRDTQTWEYLYTEWGSLAEKAKVPHKADDLVSFEDAKEHTQLWCEALLEHFVEPVEQIILGFNEVLPRDNKSFSIFWHEITTVQQLREMMEGDPEVDVDEMLAVAEFEYLSDSEKAVLVSVLRDLKAQGKGLPVSQKPLNRLLRFFTGSYTPPVGGWETARSGVLPPVNFRGSYKDVCTPVKGQTCFNELVVSKACLKDAQTLKDSIKESIVSFDFGEE